MGSEVVSFDPRIGPLGILEYAAIAEKNVNHPLAKAIVAKAQEKRIEVKMDNRNDQSRIFTSGDGNDENIIKVGRGVAVVHNGRRGNEANQLESCRYFRFKTRIFIITK